MRRRAGKTQAEVATAVGIPVQHYQVIEYGRVQPRVLLARAIADALHSTIDELWPQNPGEASDGNKDVGRSPDGDSPDVQLVRDP